MFWIKKNTNKYNAIVNFNLFVITTFDEIVQHTNYIELEGNNLNGVVAL